MPPKPINPRSPRTNNPPRPTRVTTRTGPASPFKPIGPPKPTRNTTMPDRVVAPATNRRLPAPPSGLKPKRGLDESDKAFARSSPSARINNPAYNNQGVGMSGLEQDEIDFLAGAMSRDTPYRVGDAPQSSDRWWENQTMISPLNIPEGNPGGGGGGGSDWGGGGYYGGGSGGDGGGGSAAEITWSQFDSGVQGPSWWKALKPSSLNPGSEYLAAINMLIPFLSPEDQRSVAASLYQQDSKNFGHLKPELIGVDTPEVTPEISRLFTSSDRAVKAMTALDKLKDAVGKKEEEMGGGYRYLRSVLNAVQQYGAKEGESSMTKGNMVRFMGAIDPLLNQGKSEELGAYGPMAKMLAQPFFSRGQLMPIQRTQDGRYVFGEQNRSLL